MNKPTVSRTPPALLIHERIQEVVSCEPRYRAIYEHAPIGIVLADLERRILACNPAAEHILGYCEAELSTGVFPIATHPADAARDMALYRSLADGHRDIYTIEKRYIRKDGRIVQGLLIASLVRDAEGRPSYTIGMLTDITARKAAETGLTEAQRQIELLRGLATQQERELHLLKTGLTERERVIAQMIARGRTNAQIAARLCIAEATVKVHIRQSQHQTRHNEARRDRSTSLGTRVGARDRYSARLISLPHAHQPPGTCSAARSSRQA